MKNLKITKILLSLMLVFGLTTSSFAMGQGPKNNHNGKTKIEHKVNKKDVKQINVSKKNTHHKQNVKIVKVYKDNHKQQHHHHKHHNKVVYYSCNNNSNDLVAKCIGTGVCLAMIAAINS